MRISFKSLIIICLVLFSCSSNRIKVTENYKKENTGRYSIEVPPIQELVLIAIALTPTGIKDSIMVEHRTSYYKQVISQFEKFSHLPLIVKLEKMLPTYYHHLKMDACGYYFDENGNIKKNGMYKQLNWSNKNYVEPIIEDLQNFSDTTDFLSFYNKNKEFYQSQIAILKEQAPVYKQWQWLESKFPQRYQNYRITFSPLVNGKHSTNRFKTKDFKQTVMFISGPITSNKYSKEIKEALISRVLFTEIDHNYVNPTSQKFKSQINLIFKDRTRWTKLNSFADSYSTPMAVFNEYMTWSLFCLYAKDNFDEATFTEIKQKVNYMMDTYRGFIKFSDFNHHLLKLYINNSPAQIEELYVPIINWCKKNTIANDSYTQ